ncbi:hypothetical protein P9112_014487 [Eukaryota sp. TZLM1-RC]
MDDISLIGSFDLLELVAQEIADSYENIGLHLNASKCLLIGSSAQDLVINDSIVPFTNYSSDAFKFLGCCPYLYELSCELEKLPPQIWTKCFPQSIQEIPNRSLFNLQFCCKKLQQKLSKIFESLDFDVRLGLAKKKNPAFANLLQDMCDSTSSALVTTIPQVYGTLLSDSAWTLNMRFRSFIWPDNLPHNLICKCSREITTTHLLNCKHFITF